MSGISFGAGLHKLFIMKTGARCALDISGFKTEADAVEHLVRCAMVEEDTPARRKSLLDSVAKAVQHMEEEPLPPFCDGCGQEIDPETCCCGEDMNRHNAEVEGHSAVPMGCRCLFHVAGHEALFWEQTAKGLRERLRAERAARGTP